MNTNHLYFSAISAALSMALAGCGIIDSNIYKTNEIHSHNSGKNTENTNVISSLSHISKITFNKYLNMAKNAPNNEQAQINAAIVYFEVGNVKEAIQYYKKAIVINPKDGTPYNNIGNMYNNILHNPKVALPYYLKATQLAPMNVMFWINLSNDYNSLNERSKALSTLNIALSKVNNETPTYQYQGILNDLKKLKEER